MVTDDPVILEIRKRQIKKYVFDTFYSQGVPMLLMGDEMGRTQLEIIMLIAKIIVLHG